MTYALSGLLLIAFYAGLGGACLFACVLGARAYDAHQRGLTRARNHTRRTSQ